MQVTPNAEPKIRYDITVNGPGDITLNAVRNMDTHEEWDGTDPEAVEFWEAQLARNALAMKAGAAFDSIGFYDFERKDVEGVVEFSILADFRSEWEDLIEEAFEVDPDLAQAVTEERLTTIWAA